MPKTRTQKIEGDFTTTTIRLSKKNWETLQKIALKKGWSNSGVVEKALENYFTVINDFRDLT